MSTNGKHATLAEAFVAAQAEMPAVEKDSENPHFKSRFTSHDHLVAKTRPVLNRHGISITQQPCYLPLLENGGFVHALRTTLRHTSGEEETNVMALIVAKNDMQGLGSALTYAKRYAWAAALGISTDEDDDGNIASQPPKPPPRSTSTASKPPTDKAFKAMHAMFNEKGITDRDQKLQFTQKTVNRAIETSTNLTSTEVALVTRTLAALDPAPTPVPPGADEAGPGTADKAASEPGPSAFQQKRQTVAPTPAMLNKLDEFIADGIEHRYVAVREVYVQVAAYRKQTVAQLASELGGYESDSDRLLWEPLRASLRRDEAGDLLSWLLDLRRAAGLEDDIPF